MDAKTRAMLNDAEQELLRATTVSAMRGLDEDALADLHDRVRRARAKYVKLHRRRAAAQVSKDQSRTRAGGAGLQAVVKAEAFEDALSRVSARLAAVAAKAAEALKKERLAAAAAVSAPGPKAKATARSAARPASKATKRASGGSTKTGRARAPKPVEKKRAASARAGQKRSTAKRDARN